MAEKRPEPLFGHMVDPLSLSEGQELLSSLSYLGEEVCQELVRAINKFGSFNSTHEGWAAIFEELDELWDRVKANTAQTSKARKEAIQIAAMALRFVYDLIDPRHP